MTTTNKVVTLAVTVALIAAVIATTSFASDTSDSSTSPSIAPPTDATPSFAVLRRTRGAGDDLPALERKMFANLAAIDGADLDRARAVGTIGMKIIWVIPGPGKVCLAIPDPVDGYGVGCKTLKEAAEGKLVAPLVGGPLKLGEVRVALFVPDGVRQVSAVAKDGARRVLDVSDNVAVAELPDSDRIEFVDSSGVGHATEVPGTPAFLAEK